jgi:hypothetical protein
VQWLVLRHELPDQHVLDHRIVASYAPIAPLVTMSCRLLLRRVASCGVLPRERFSPMDPKRTPSHRAAPEGAARVNRAEAATPCRSEADILIRYFTSGSLSLLLLALFLL